MAIIQIIIGVLVILGSIGFAIWFFMRTPDNLEGYYSKPVTIFVIFIVIAIVVGVTLTLIF